MKPDISVFRREPSPDEVAAANEEIAKQELAILALEQRAQALIAEMADLRRRQAAHRDSMARCKGVTTLARRIPEELLAKIFEHSVMDGWTRAPVVVSHVCSSWRKAATSPRVWSHIYVDGDNTDALGRTRFWLMMARHAPLQVSVVASWRTPASHLVDCMKLLGRHSVQWETLNLVMTGLHNAWQVAAQCHRPMPYLHEIKARIEVQFDGTIDGDPETFALADVFTADNAPKLRSIELACNVLPDNLAFPSHITSFSLSIEESPARRPISAASLFAALETLPALEHLTLSLPLYYEQAFVAEEDPERALVLDRLISLTLYGPTDLNGLLAHLWTPALKRLHLRSLEDLGYRQEPIGPTLLPFLQRSEPALELLELHDIDLSPEHFIACTSAVASLQELRLHESYISDATLKLLIGPGGSCPLLTRIDLRWCSQLSGRALVDLVRGRNCRDGDWSCSSGHPAVSRVTEVAVLNCCFVEEQDVLDLARMTVCRVSLRDEDYCRKCSYLMRGVQDLTPSTGTRHCCDNARYRLRLQLRHMTMLTGEERRRLRLIV